MLNDSSLTSNDGEGSLTCGDPERNFWWSMLGCFGFLIPENRSGAYYDPTSAAFQAPLHLPDCPPLD